VTLIAIGGAEDKQGDMTVLKRVLQEAKGTASQVVVVTTATEDPAGAKTRYEEAFGKLGVTPAVLHIDSRTAANDKAIVRQLQDADVVFFSGGDQLRLTSFLAGTQSMDAVQEKYTAGNLVVAGTSAGAAAASSLMIYGGDPAKAMHKGEVSISAGFSFAAQTVMDTYFSERDRLPRLFNAVAANPSITGIGLDEDTAVVLKANGVLEVVGSGTVTFVEGRNITQSNLTDISTGDLMKVEGMVTHRLSSGERYDLRQHKPVAGFPY
jgi:cyanophycinase